MKKGIIAGLVIAMGVGVSVPTALPTIAQAKSHKKVVKKAKTTKKTTTPKKFKGINSKKYYTKFQYGGLEDYLKKQHKSQHDILSTLKVMGMNRYWVKVVSPNGILAYTSEHFSKANVIKKKNYTTPETVIKFEQNSQGYLVGYQHNSLVPVVSIKRDQNHTVFKTLYGSYITAEKSQVKEVNYYKISK